MVRTSCIPLRTARITCRDWYHNADIDRGGEIPCYGGSTSAANITWCVYVYNPQYEVKVCLNNEGITYQTEAAKELNMEKILYMKTVIIISMNKIIPLIILKTEMLQWKLPWNNSGALLLPACICCLCYFRQHNIIH